MTPTHPNPSHLWLPSAEDMKAWDASTIAAGTQALELMERAGRAVAEVILKRFSASLKRVVILAGSGNNGGDGVVCARYLAEAGAGVTVVLSRQDRHSELLEHNLKRLAAVSTECVCSVLAFCVSEDSSAQQPYRGIDALELKTLLKAGTLYIDALLGTGQKGAPNNTLAEIVRLLNEFSSLARPCIALDAPTGSDVSSGVVFSPSVVAQMTMCIQAPKLGMTQYPLRQLAGELVVVDAGISAQPTKYQLLSPRNVRLPRRHPSSHKGSHGPVVIIGGSPCFPGAPLLAARAALLSGAGLIQMAFPQSQDYIPQTPEITLLPFADWNGLLCEESVSDLTPGLESARALVVGPGISTESQVITALGLLFDKLSSLALPVVLDADGLNILSILHAQNRKLALPKALVITPHPGEAARLLGKSSAWIAEDRFRAAAELAEKFAATVVLKGAGTIVVGASAGAVDVVGGPELATAGSGDVLSGVVASLIAQGLGVEEAAHSAVLVHSVAGRIAALEYAGVPSASSIVDALPRALAEIPRMKDTFFNVS